MHSLHAERSRLCCPISSGYCLSLYRTPFVYLFFSLIFGVVLTHYFFSFGMLYFYLYTFTYIYIYLYVFGTRSVWFPNTLAGAFTRREYATTRARPGRTSRRFVVCRSADSCSTRRRHDDVVRGLGPNLIAGDAGVRRLSSDILSSPVTRLYIYICVCAGARVRCVPRTSVDGKNF